MLILSNIEFEILMKKPGDEAFRVFMQILEAQLRLKTN